MCSHGRMLFAFRHMIVSEVQGFVDRGAGAGLLWIEACTDNLLFRCFFISFAVFFFYIDTNDWLHNVISSDLSAYLGTHTVHQC